MLISEVEVQNKQSLYREYCEQFIKNIKYPKKNLGGSDFWTLGFRVDILKGVLNSKFSRVAEVPAEFWRPPTIEMPQFLWKTPCSAQLLSQWSFRFFPNVLLECSAEELETAASWPSLRTSGNGPAPLETGVTAAPTSSTGILMHFQSKREWCWLLLHTPESSSSWVKDNSYS